MCGTASSRSLGSRGLNAPLVELLIKLVELLMKKDVVPTPSRMSGKRFSGALPEYHFAADAVTA
jgi:hypothetical protein